MAAAVASDAGSAVIEAFGLRAPAHGDAPQMREMFDGHAHDDLLALPAWLPEMMA